MYNVSYVHFEGTYRKPIHNELCKCIKINISILNLFGRRYLTDMYKSCIQNIVFFKQNYFRTNVLFNIKISALSISLKYPKMLKTFRTNIVFNKFTFN